MSARWCGFRQRFAQLRARHWLEGRKADGNHDVLWLRPDAAEMQDDDWKFPEGRFLAYVLAAADDGGEPLFVVFNGAQEAIEATFPAWADVAHWTRVLDTAGNAVLVGARRRSRRRQIHRAAGLDHGVRGQAMMRGQSASAR